MSVAERRAGRACAVVVAAVAAYASYEHQRDFALRGGADRAGAYLWPLSVDGLLLLATIGLLKPADQTSRRTRRAVRLAFALGIAVSLAANVAAAPRLAWHPVLVAGWPPVALLLAVELLAQDTGRREQAVVASSEKAEQSPPANGNSPSVTETPFPPDRETPKGRRGSRQAAARTRTRAGESAEQVMWNYFRQEQSRGATPTGAELDRVAGTNNYGRAVLAKWRRDGRISGLPAQGHARASGVRDGERSP